MMESDGNSKSSNVNRRRVLKSIGASGVAVVGASGTAAAGRRREFSQEEIDAARAGYQDLASIESALAEETALLGALVDEGILSEPTAEAVGIQTVGKPSSDEDMNVTVVPADGDDSVVTEIVVDGEIDGTWIQMTFQPETDVAHVVTRSSESGSLSQVYASAAYGCDSDCDDCDCSCYPVKFSTYCGGTYGSRAECHCDDGW